MDIISKLKNSEDKAIIEGLTMMTYNPSIGRVFEKGGVDKFREIIIEKVKPKLRNGILKNKLFTIQISKSIHTA